MEGKYAVFLVALFATGLVIEAQRRKCRKSPKLDAISKALQCPKSRNQTLQKREISWPIDCTHIAIMKDEYNSPYFSMEAYECCHDCEFPGFLICKLSGYPDWFCGSEAYDCVIKCRQLGIGPNGEDVPARTATKNAAVVGAEEKKRRRRKKQAFCVRRGVKCPDNSGENCCEFGCVRLNRRKCRRNRRT